GTNVVLYQGLSQDLGPISMSEPLEVTDIALEDLPEVTRRQVENTISAADRDSAEKIIYRLEQVAVSNLPPPAVSPAPSDGGGASAREARPRTRPRCPPAPIARSLPPMRGRRRSGHDRLLHRPPAPPHAGAAAGLRGGDRGGRLRPGRPRPVRRAAREPHAVRDRRRRARARAADRGHVAHPVRGSGDPAAGDAA